MRRKTPLVVTFILFFLTFSGLTERVFADVSAQLKQAGAYQNNRQYEQAEAIYQQIVTAFPDTNDALEAQEQLVLIYIADGTQQQADAAFEKLLADFSEHKGIAAAVWWIAKRYNTSKKYEKALQLNQYNVEHFPKDIHAMWSQMNIIRYYISDGNEPAADAAFNKLLTVFCDQPTLPEEVWRIAKMYSGLKRNDKAFKLYQYDVEHFPKDIHAMWSQMNIIRSHIRDANEPAADAAVKKLLTVFANQPTLPKEIYQLATAYNNAGRFDKADQIHQYFINNKTEHTIWAKTSMARSNIALGNDAAAEVDVNNLIADFKDHTDLPEAIFTIGEEYYEKASRLENKGRDAEARGNLEKTLAVWKRIIEELPKLNSTVTAHAYYFSAECYSRLSQHSKAIEYYQKIVGNWPDYEYAWNAQFMIGYCYKQLRDAGVVENSVADVKIKAAYERVIQNYPDCPAANAARNWLEHNAKSNEGVQK